MVQVPVVWTIDYHKAALPNPRELAMAAELFQACDGTREQVGVAPKYLNPTRTRVMPTGVTMDTHGRTASALLRTY